MAAAEKAGAGVKAAGLAWQWSKEEEVQGKPAIHREREQGTWKVDTGGPVEEADVACGPLNDRAGRGWVDNLGGGSYQGLLDNSLSDLSRFS